MFKLCEKYEVNGNNLKCYYKRYSPSETSTIGTVISQIYINIPRNGSVNSLLSSYLDINFYVLHTVTGNIYVDGDDIRLINLRPIGFF